MNKIAEKTLKLFFFSVALVIIFFGWYFVNGKAIFGSFVSSKEMFGSFGNDIKSVKREIAPQIQFNADNANALVAENTEESAVVNENEDEDEAKQIVAENIIKAIEEKEYAQQ